MKKKTVFKVMTDIAMTVCLLLLMPYELVGTLPHEIIGTVMIVLLIVHHILNRRWTASLFKGKYTFLRIVQTALVVLILVCSLGSAVSGIALSRHLYRFLPSFLSASFARKVHMLCAYWGMVLMSLHLGFHWSMMMNMARKIFRKPSKVRRCVVRLCGFATAGYGVYAFVKRGIADYLFLKIAFVFFDHSQPVVFFLLDYAACMGTFVLIGYYLSRLLTRIGRRKAAAQ